MSKRKSPVDGPSQGVVNKKQKQSSLGSYIILPAHLKVPETIAASQELFDRDSHFIAHAATCSSQAQAEVLQRHIREAHISDPAGHEMLAYRVLELKSGTKGGNETDFYLKSGADNDKEAYGGDTALRILDREGAVDKAVVISRWFGGTLLGKVRFRHIEQVTREALEALQKAEGIKEALAQLQILDEAAASASIKLGLAMPKQVKYDETSLPTLQRLLVARQKRLEMLEKRLQKDAASVGDV